MLIELQNMAEGERALPPRMREINDFCANTTAHGLGHVAAASSWKERIFWILILIAAFIISAYQIHCSCSVYMQYPTQTEVSLVTKEKLFFPGVTVCNINPVKQSDLNTSFWHNIVSIYFRLFLSSVLKNFRLEAESSQFFQINF